MARNRSLWRGSVGARLLAVAVIGIVGLGPIASLTSARTPRAAPLSLLTSPIDRTEQTDLDFCERSHWAQPWRAYLDTRPAAALAGAVGINLNVDNSNFVDTARLLESKGFARARIEVGWSEISYEDPDQLRAPELLSAKLRVLRAAHLRPLILLNANHGIPGPARLFDLVLAAPAAAGDRRVQLDAASAAQVVPGLTGLSDLRGAPKAAEAIITAVSLDGVATLSQPLPGALAAGPQRAATLRFGPFTKPTLADGTPNPAFERTMDGWLRYVAAVTRTARAALGDDDFDLEIWNELTFGADFLDAGRYYDRLPPELAGTGSTEQTILERTIRWLRDPDHGVSGAGISDGFAGQTPFAAAANSPNGLTALSKHPYSGPRLVFNPAAPAARPCRPLDARGRSDGRQVGSNLWLDGFVPSYTSFFPEYYLNAIQTEHLIRDISPFTTYIGDVAFGRAPLAARTKAPMEVWLTEMGFDPGYIGRSAAQTRRMQAKATLRTLVSFVSKGVSAIDLFAARGNEFGLIDDRFFRSGEARDAGLTVDAIGRMMARIGTSDPRERRALSLRSVGDRHDHVQFKGDGSAAHPPLYDREVVGFFPYQTGADRFVVPSYVMTRNLADPLAPERFRLQIGGLRGRKARVTAYDPLTNRRVPVAVTARTRSAVTVEVALTDSPRLLEIADAA